MSLAKTDDTAHESASSPLLTDTLAQSPFRDDLDGFTHIVIQDLSPDDFPKITDAGFVDELRKLLPLKPDKDEPFLRRFTGRKAGQVKAMMVAPEYCRTIDAYWGLQEDGTLRQLWKYFPAFRSDITFPDDNVHIGYSADRTFAYYIVHSVAVDVHRSKDAERENGFWVRNQNFLVKRTL